MKSLEFNAGQIETEYRRLGYQSGWTFMATPEVTLRQAQVALVGLNPGGGGAKDDYPYAGQWDSPGGNAYFVEKWGLNGTETSIQGQVRAWHSLLALEPNDTFCAQFVPFRSPSWGQLAHKAEALAFAQQLWRWALTESPASLLITMGKLPAAYLSELLDAKPIATLPAGWGSQTIDVYESRDGRRVVAMPHPSRFVLFGRADEGSRVAEQSFGIAVGSLH